MFSRGSTFLASWQIGSPLGCFGAHFGSFLEHFGKHFCGFGGSWKQVEISMILGVPQDPEYWPVGW